MIWASLVPLLATMATPQPTQIPSEDSVVIDARDAFVEARGAYYERIPGVRSAAEAADKRGDFRQALALHEQAAEDCEQAHGFSNGLSVHSDHLPIYQCNRLWRSARKLADKAGDVSAGNHAAARSAQIAQWIEDFRNKIRSQNPVQKATDYDGNSDPYDIVDIVIYKKKFTDPARQMQYVERELGWRSSKRTENFSKSKYYLTALILIDASIGRSERAKANLKRIKKYVGKEHCSTLYRDIARDAVSYGNMDVAIFAGKLGLNFAIHSAEPCRNDSKAVAMWTAYAASDLVANLIKVGRHRDAAIHYGHLYSYCIRYDPDCRVEDVSYLEVGGNMFQAFPEGHATARTLYRKAIEIHAARLDYLKTADIAAAAERRRAVPMFKNVVSNTWKLALVARR